MNDHPAALAEEVARKRTTDVAAKVIDDESQGEDRTGFFLDGHRIGGQVYQPESGVLPHPCPRLKLGRCQVQIVATDGGRTVTTETVRFHVVLR